VQPFGVQGRLGYSRSLGLVRFRKQHGSSLGQCRSLGQRRGLGTAAVWGSGTPQAFAAVWGSCAVWGTGQTGGEALTIAINGDN